MILWLSRVQLNPFSRLAMSLAADPTKLHDAIYSLFERENSGRLLFRVDTDNEGPSILLQSPIEPCWNRLTLTRRDLRSEPLSKEVEISLSKGQELTFRLLARPARRASSGKGNPPGPRGDLRTDEERLAWLNRKAELGGFRVTTCGLTILTLPAVKSNLGFRSKSGAFTAVRFDGELAVIDPATLEATVLSGIGAQKAFGFGMLSLGKI